MLSCLAAVQAPIIMMSQNRQEARDRLRSQNDYRLNLKAELEIRQLHEKLDHLLQHQWERLVEIQQIQIDLMNELTAGRHPRRDRAQGRGILQLVGSPERRTRHPACLGLFEVLCVVVSTTEVKPIAWSGLRKLDEPTNRPKKLVEFGFHGAGASYLGQCDALAKFVSGHGLCVAWPLSLQRCETAMLGRTQPFAAIQVS
jgi:hypothetical protein